MPITRLSYNHGVSAVEVMNSNRNYRSAVETMMNERLSERQREYIAQHGASLVSRTNMREAMHVTDPGATYTVECHMLALGEMTNGELSEFVERFG